MIKENKNKGQKVILYRTRTCPWCHRTEEFFKSHNIKFRSVYVDKDHEAAHEMVHKSGQMGVPVIDIDGSIVVGYDVESLKRLLNLA